MKVLFELLFLLLFNKRSFNDFILINFFLEFPVQFLINIYD